MTNNKGDFDAQQFLTALASGNPPDLVYMDRNLVGTYAAKGAIQPMTDCIAQQKIDMSQYRPAAMTPITLDKVVYGIPEFYIVTANLVDKRVVAKAGLQLSDIQTADWAELEATAKKLSEAQGGKIRRLGYDSKMPDSFPLWAMANGAQIVKPDGVTEPQRPQGRGGPDFNLRLVKEQGGWNSYKAFRDSFDIFGAQEPADRGPGRCLPDGELVRQRAARLHSARACSSAPPWSRTARARRSAPSAATPG